MNKIQTIFKTIFIAAVVFVIAQSCIPTIPTGGNPTPTLANEFDVNISSYTYNMFTPYNSQSDTIVIDSDSIEFSTTYSGGTMGGLNQVVVIKPISNKNAYEYITDAENLSQFYYASIFYSGVTITNNLDSVKQWKNIANSYPYMIYIHGATIFPGVYQLMTLPLNTDQFLVFRKLKSIGYQYYWIKIRYANNNSTFTLSVLNGNYQMNSIITGQ